MSRTRNHRIKLQNTKFAEQEHKSTNFWLLLESAPSGNTSTLKLPANNAYVRSRAISNRGMP